MILGHLAVSALEYRYVKVAFVPVMAAAVVPDLVDKIAHYGFDRNASGRMWGHTLLGVLVSSLVVCLLFGRRNGASWALGYVSHLVCDISGVVPWLAPLVTYEFPPAMDFMATLWTGLTKPLFALEIGLALWAFVALRPRVQNKIRELRPGPRRHVSSQADSARGRNASV